MAVYTDISATEMRAFLRAYDLGGLLSFDGIIEGVENSNYIVRTEHQTVILTLYEKRVRETDLPFFIGLMEHLAGHGFTCPQPVYGRDGQALRRLADRPAALFTFLEGRPPARILPLHCRELGRALAGLHLAGADFAGTRANDLGLPGWQRLCAAVTPDAGKLRPDLPDILERELSFLRQNWPEGLPAGICHADLFPDNAFFRGQRLSGVIDFYFACTDLLAYDLAVCLNAWCFEAGGDFNISRARALLAGYQEKRPLTAAEYRALPLLARGAALRFLLTRLYDLLNHPPGARVRPKDPGQFLTRLRFHQRLECARGYGLAEPEETADAGARPGKDPA